MTCANCGLVGHMTLRQPGGQSFYVCDDCGHQEPLRRYYVTVLNGSRVGWLLGPYSDHDDALANVDRGRELAKQADPWAHFYAFGTTGVLADAKQPEAVFGA